MFYEFPDGSQIPVLRRLTPAAADRIVNDARRRFPPKRRRNVVDGDPVRDYPRIDLTRLTASPHAQQRLAEMWEQAVIEWAEIVTALTDPNRVHYSEHHGSWAYVGNRIAVCVITTQARGHVISTILWSEGDLWDKHPRPETTH